MHILVQNYLRFGDDFIILYVFCRTRKLDLADNIFLELQEYILTALAAKTVVFVTHQVEFLPAADLILVLPSFPSSIDCIVTHAIRFSEFVFGQSF